jgi:hypothetical protein
VKIIKVEHSINILSGFADSHQLIYLKQYLSMLNEITNSPLFDNTLWPFYYSKLHSRRENSAPDKVNLNFTGQSAAHARGSVMSTVKCAVSGGASSARCHPPWFFARHGGGGGNKHAMGGGNNHSIGARWQKWRLHTKKAHTQKLYNTYKQRHLDNCISFLATKESTSHFMKTYVL